MCLKCAIPFTSSAAAVAYIIYLAKPGLPDSTLFSYHPVCMSLAFTLLLPGAITALCPSRPSFMSRSSSILLHRILTGAAAGMAAAGFAVIYNVKNINQKPHFTSPHSIAGAVTCSLLLVQLTLGAMLQYRLVLPYKTLRPFHAWTGVAVYAMASMTVAGGLTSAWFLKESSVTAAAVLAGIQVFGGVWIARQVFGARGGNTEKSSKKSK